MIKKWRRGFLFFWLFWWFGVYLAMFFYNNNDKIMGKRWLPEITDRFTDKTKREIKGWSLENTVPCNWNTTFCMEGWYKVNIHGQVIWQNNSPLTQRFRKWKRSPFVILTFKKKNGNEDPSSSQKEQRLDHLMRKYFWPYIEWYSETKRSKNKDKTYIVAPKDGNWSDMSLTNLKYTEKKEYELDWTKKWLLMGLLPFFEKIKSDDDLATLLSVSRWWVSRVKTELKEKGRIGNDKLNNLVISYKTYKIYEALLACEWLTSNLDIAKKLRPEEDFSTKITQDMLTDKVSRVRRKLYDAWLIKKYNTYQQKVNIADVRQELEKMLIANRGVEKWKRNTHEEIAQIFGLEKQQVDNYSRQMKKKDKKRDTEES